MTDNMKYLEISERIKEKIINNIYKQGELLPSEPQLSKEYSTSRGTVRRAMTNLAASGFVKIIPGKGTFVYLTFEDMYEVNLNMNKIITGRYESAILYSAKIIKPDIYQVYYLQIYPDERVIYIEWILKREDKIVAFDTKSIPYLSGITISESDLGFTDLRSILSSKYPEYELREMATISNCMPDEKICSIMHLSSQEPLVVLNLVICNDKSEPLGWNKIYIVPDEFILHGEII